MSLQRRTGEKKQVAQKSNEREKGTEYPLVLYRGPKTTGQQPPRDSGGGGKSKAKSQSLDTGSRLPKRPLQISGGGESGGARTTYPLVLYKGPREASGQSSAPPTSLSGSPPTSRAKNNPAYFENLPRHVHTSIARKAQIPQAENYPFQSEFQQKKEDVDRVKAKDMADMQSDPRGTRRQYANMQALVPMMSASRRANAEARSKAQRTKLAMKAAIATNTPGDAANRNHLSAMNDYHDAHALSFTHLVSAATVAEHCERYKDAGKFYKASAREDFKYKKDWCQMAALEEKLSRNRAKAAVAESNPSSPNYNDLVNDKNKKQVKYEAKVRRYRATHKQAQIVRAEFSGSDSSDSEASFSDVPTEQQTAQKYRSKLGLSEDALG